MMAAISTALAPLIVKAAETTPERENNTYFSRGEVSKYFKQAQEAKAATPKESHLRSEEEGPVVDLTPMTVKTDDSPLLQEVRKRIEMGPESIRNRLAELSPMLARDAAYDARAAERFFTEDPNIGPTDSGAPARVDFVPILRSAGKAVQSNGD